jgi:hypothetical protein
MKATKQDDGKRFFTDVLAAMLMVAMLTVAMLMLLLLLLLLSSMSSQLAVLSTAIP